jgi:pre-mRNA-splicing factor CWC26
MLEYIRKNKDGFDSVQSSKPKYRGPPPPPNRYNLLPGPRWDGVDRSNGFEKKYYESITAKKAFQDEAYKWSTEDM